MIEVTDKDISVDFRDTAYHTTIIEFYSPSCMPCRKMMTILEEVEKEVWEDAVVFYKIDATENPEFVKRFGVMSIPTIIILQGDIVEEKFTGLVSKSAIMRAID